MIGDGLARGAADGDDGIARRLASEAGALLLTVRAELGCDDRPRLAAEGDARSQELLARRLEEECPGDAILSEEAADDHARLGARRVWVIDPLDGTREFAEGRSDWAVHVALVVGGALAAGAVALPAMGRTLSTQPAPVVPDGAEGRALRIAVSRSRPPEVATVIGRRLGAELVQTGSAGYKAMAVVLGQVDAYVHAGGQHEWDSAAPVAVATAAGLHASRLDGSPLRYNQPDPWLPDLLICRPELAGILLEAASTHR